MAYMSLICPCAACGTILHANPDLVPSLNISGELQAVCAPCVARYNELHPELPDFIPHPDAYEAQEVDG